LTLPGQSLKLHGCRPLFNPEGLASKKKTQTLEELKAATKYGLKGDSLACWPLLFEAAIGKTVKNNKTVASKGARHP